MLTARSSPRTCGAAWFGTQARRSCAWRVRLYFALLMPLYWLRQLKLIGEDTFRRPWVERMTWVIAGWSEEEAARAWKWIVDD